MTKYGGLRCAGCGSHELKLLVSSSDYSDGYEAEVGLVCETCGRMYPICKTKRDSDVGEYDWKKINEEEPKITFQ